MATKKATKRNTIQKHGAPRRKARRGVASKYVVVRTCSAGVHVGVLYDRVGKKVELLDARRIWSWKGANTLHEISLRGVGEGSRVSEMVQSITLIEAIEVIPCTREAEANLRAAKWSS